LHITLTLKGGIRIQYSGSPKKGFKSGSIIDFVDLEHEEPAFYLLPKNCMTSKGKKDNHVSNEEKHIRFLFDHVELSVLSGIVPNAGRVVPIP